MAITKPIRPTPQQATPAKDDALEKFIQGAPDGKPKQDTEAKAKPVDEGREATEQITIRLPLSMLARLDAASKAQGIARAAYMKRAIALQLKEDEQ